MLVTRRHLYCAIATFVAGTLGLVAGCADEPALPPVPAALVDDARVPGFDAIRQWGDAPGAIGRSAWHDQAAAVPPPSADTQGPLNVLAISGGGANGSFAAGLLNGWTRAGSRPQFHVVTGVSVGALEAPFAFLGSKYDFVLRDMFARLSARDIVTRKPPLVAYFGDSLDSRQPLAALVDELIDEPLVSGIAVEHRKGRRLYVATTNVYAGHQVIWDIGAIAASGRPEAADLIRRILLASAAVPIVLPPVYFDVQAGSTWYHEMHADGGLTREAFIGPPDLDWTAATRALQTAPQVNFFVIRNGRAKAEYMVMEPRLLPLGQHAMHQLAQSLGVADLHRIYLRAQSEHASFRAAWIGSDFSAPWSGWYDPGYVEALFDYGYEKALSGDVWRTDPPGLAPATPR